jgi:hypothetical protein
LVKKTEKEDKYKIEIIRKGYRVPKPLGEISCRAKSEDEFNSLFSDINYNNPLPLQITNRIKTIGENLYDSYFSKELKDEYWTIKNGERLESVQVVTDEPFIPWEIIRPYLKKDGSKKSDGFLCELYSFSRWISTEIDRNNNKPVREVRIVLPKSNLEEALNEQKSLEDFLKDYNITQDYYCLDFRYQGRTI